MNEFWHAFYLGSIGGVILAMTVLIYRILKGSFLELYNKYNNRTNKLFVIFLLPYLYIFKSLISILILNNGHWIDSGIERFWVEPYSIEYILLNPSIHDFLYWFLLILYLILVLILNYKKEKI